MVTGGKPPVGGQSSFGGPEILSDEALRWRESKTTSRGIKPAVGVEMTEDANIGRSWKSVARSDADVDLLQRSINHVEHLLARLEFGAVPTSQGGDGSDGSGTAAVASAPDATASAQADGPTTVAAPMRSGPQADALRITLKAHEEAYQICVQAAAMHAKAVAESERLLVEVQQMREQLRAGAISEAAVTSDDRQAATRTQADAAERDARKRVDTADADADAVRLLVHDTFSDLAARLSDALACVQQLTAAIGPEGTVPVALAEGHRRCEALGDRGSDNPGAGVSASKNALDGAPAEVSTADGTVEPAAVPPTRGLPDHVFRVARR